MGFLFKFIFNSNRIYLGSAELEARFKRLLMFLVVCLSSHVILMMSLENLTLVDAIWFTLTTTFTVGYGDIIIHSVGAKIATVILVYFGCILTIGKAASDYFEFISLKKVRITSGRWRHKMEGHLVIFGSPKHGHIDFFNDLKKEILFNFGQSAPECLVVTSLWGNHIPDILHSLEYRWVNSSQYDPACLERICLDKAAYVLVLVDTFIPNEIDYANVELVSRIRETGYSGPIVAEVTSENHRARMKKVGATGVQRPMRSHPEILIKTLLFPGTEEILDNLFSAKGDNLIKKEFIFKGSWDELVSLCLAKHGGLPLSVLTWDGKIVTNPINEKFLDTKAVYVLVKEDELLVKRGLKIHSNYLKRSA